MRDSLLGLNHRRGRTTRAGAAERDDPLPHRRRRPASSLPMSVVVDLITPPPSPARAAQGTHEEIDLISEDESENQAVQMATPAQPSSAALGKRKAPEEQDRGDEERDDDDDDDVREMDAPERPVFAAASTSAADDDEDIQFEGRTGALALSDFPHCRMNCVTHKFFSGNESSTCQHCYCCAPRRAQPSTEPMIEAVVAAADRRLFVCVCVRWQTFATSLPRAARGGRFTARRFRTTRPRAAATGSGSVMPPGLRRRFQ